jgi:hypothetical protein
VSEEDQKAVIAWLRNDNASLEGFLLAYCDAESAQFFDFFLKKYKSDFLIDLARWIKQTKKPLGERLTVRQRDTVTNKILPTVVKKLFS